MKVWFSAWLLVAFCAGFVFGLVANAALVRCL